MRGPVPPFRQWRGTSFRSPSTNDWKNPQMNPSHRQVAFVDQHLDGLDILAAGIGAADVVVVPAGAAPLSFIAATLRDRAPVDALHVLSHGEPGALLFSGGRIDADALLAQTEALAAIAAGLSDRGAILVYGCRVGEGMPGARFLDLLADATGASIAAAEGLVGAADAGGSWALTARRGDSAVASFSLADYPHVLSASLIDMNGITFEENAAAQVVDAAASFTGFGSTNFSGGSLTFAITDGTATETLTLTTVATADITAGVVSVVGTDVHVGNGTGTDVVGRIDATHDGTGGQTLRITFPNGFQNGSFDQGSNGSTTITGWTVTLDSGIRLDGNSIIAGHPTPIDGTYPVQNTSGDLASPGFGGSGTLSDYDSGYTGDLAINLDTGMGTVASFGVLRGPYVVSNGSVTFSAGDQLSFAWKALGTGDAYDAFGYLVDVDTGDTITLLDDTGTTPGTETSWATVTRTIQAGEEGTYRFVFVAGSFDATGGTAVGGQLMVDDVTVTLQNPPLLAADVLEGLSRLLTYGNTADDFDGTSRTLTITAETAGGAQTFTDTATITIDAVNDAPSLSGGDTIASVAEDTANPAGESVADMLGANFSDPDAEFTPEDTFAGIVIVADGSDPTDGAWEYSTDAGTTWFAVGSVAADDGLVLDTAALLRFLPAAGYNGTPGSLSVHALDSTWSGGVTSGATRVTTDVGAAGATYVSASAVSISTSITPVLDLDGFALTTTNNPQALDGFTHVAFPTLEFTGDAGLDITIDGPGAGTSLLDPSQYTVNFTAGVGIYDPGLYTITFIDSDPLTAGLQPFGDGAATANGSDGLYTVFAEDAANALSGTAGSFTLDSVAPAAAGLSDLALSDDNGQVGDFRTTIADQTITATLGAALDVGERMLGSIDGGTTWTDISSFVTGTDLAWTGVTLELGTNDLMLQVVDQAGNVGLDVTQTYRLSAPVMVTRNGGAPEPAEMQARPGLNVDFTYLGGAENEVIVATDGADFLALGAGDDAADGGDGNDILDGGTGSNFLTGGAGWDTFFVDARGTGSTWSTITDFQPGEWLVLWGWREGVSRSTWAENGGAPGYTGATLHADVDGNGLIDTSVTFSGRSVASMPAPISTTLDGTGLLWFT